MCQSGDYELVEVTIPADLSCTGESYRKKMQIDKCLAPLIRAMDRRGIATRGCCCGHGERPGSIMMGDGTEIALPMRPETKDPTSESVGAEMVESGVRR